MDHSLVLELVDLLEGEFVLLLPPAGLGSAYHLLAGLVPHLAVEQGLQVTEGVVRLQYRQLGDIGTRDRCAWGNGSGSRSGGAGRTEPPHHVLLWRPVPAHNKGRYYTQTKVFIIQITWVFIHKQK